MIHHRDGARFPPDVPLGIQAKEFNRGCDSPDNLVSQAEMLSFWNVLQSPQSTRELCRSHIRFLVTSLTKALLPIAQFGQAASSKKGLGVSNLLLFKNDEGHCALEDLQCYRNVLVLFPRSVPQHNPVSELYGLRPHGLVFALTCTVKCGNLHKSSVSLSKSSPIKL